MTIGLGLIGLVLLIVLGGWFFLRGNSAIGAAGSADLFEVTRGSFDVTIPASGELAALRQVEIRNPLETRDAVITYIIDEGETVEKGDVLVTFADEEIRNEIAERELSVLAAQNALTAAENELEIQKSRNNSNLSQAQTDLELAQITYEQWKSGDLKSRRQELEIALETAERNLERLTEKFEQSKSLIEEGFISRDEYRRDEIAKLEAEADLEKAKLDIEVYEKYQRVRDEKEKQAAVERAREELERVKQQNAAELERAMADVAAKRGELENRQQRLDYWKDELAKTEIRAPSPGLVVYASSLGGSGHRGDDDDPPEVGAEVRRNESIIVLPDVSEMTADVKVHESISGRIEKGQRATVTCDTLPDTALTGTVMSVSVLAQTGSWRDPNRRDYTVRIKLDDTQGLGLKPSMRSKAEIFLDHVDDAIFVPLQAVFRRAGKTFVYVAQGDGFAQREVRVGRASETKLEILDGLQPGDRVLLREPNASEIVQRLDFPEIAQPGGPGGEPNADGADRDGADASGAAESRPNRPRGGGDPSAMISRFDADGDGQLQREELPDQMQGMFDRADSDGDGAITAEELGAMRRPQ